MGTGRLMENRVPGAAPRMSAFDDGCSAPADLRAWLVDGHWPYSPDLTDRQNDQETDDGSNDHHDLDPRVVKALAREDECDRKVPRPRADGEHPPRIGVWAADQPSEANAENSE